MAIPKFYSILRHQWPDVIENAPADPKCHTLYVDMNTVLFICLADSSSLQEFHVKTENYIQLLVNTIKPEQLLYLAFDGVPPLAKLKGQAQRRRSRINTQQVIDSNVLTPGSEVMQNVSNHLTKFIKETIIPNQKGIKVILSDSLVPGEGEHKIIKHLRKHSENQSFKTFIYGTDADLIVLCLSLQNTDVTLIRESNISKIEKKFEVLYMDVLRSHLLQNYSLEIQKKVGTDLIFLDLLLVLSIIGNDFLPIPMGLFVESSTINKLLELLREFHMEVGLNIVDMDGTINHDHIAKLFHKFEKFDMERFRLENPIKRSVLDAKILELQLASLSLKDRKSTIKDSVQKAEAEYFEESKLKTYSRQKLTKVGTQTLCKDYIRGIQWLLLYYLDDCPSWNWINANTVSPYLSDLKKGLKNSDMEFEKGSPILPLHHLSLVLPPKSKSLLPDSYRNSDEYDQFSSLLRLSNSASCSDIFKFVKYFEDEIDPSLKDNEIFRNTFSKPQIFI